VSRRRERGVVLVAATTALALLTIVAVGLARTAAVDQHLAANALAAVQGDALARSGVAVAAVVLAETRADDAPDTLDAPWARDLGPQSLGAGWVSVRVEDETRRIDLNAPELRDAVRRLLDGLGLDVGLADAIADWTDPDDVPRPAGAERDFYLAATPPLVPRNGPLATVTELLRVRGVDARVLARLAPYVTVAGEHAVNPNTASREVLQAVVGDAAAVDRLLAARVGSAIDDERLTVLLGDAADVVRPLLTTRAQRYTARAVAGVGRVRRGIEATIWAPGGVEPAVVAWRPFVPALSVDERTSR
jgi:general secretion pathway protein K